MMWKLVTLSKNRDKHTRREHPQVVLMLGVAALSKPCLHPRQNFPRASYKPGVEEGFQQEQSSSLDINFR